MEQVYERLAEAVMLTGNDAAIRVKATYEPQAGPHAKVFPPTYIEVDGEKYAIEKRWDDDGSEVDVVVLDSYQSQANRVETALLAVSGELALPHLVMETTAGGKKISVSSLEAPHRSRDAYFLDSQIGDEKFDSTDIGEALNDATARDARAYLQFAPYDLVFGVWDSHRGKRVSTKFPRAYTSEILGWNVLRGKRGATKSDPLNLPGASSVPLDEWRPDVSTNNKKSNKTEKLSELGHGMVPVAATESAGGVSVRSIERVGVLSLNAFARYGFPHDHAESTRAGRTLLATIGILGDRLAFARAGVHLRSGSDLVTRSDDLSWVGRDGDEAFSLSVEDAISLFHLAREKASEAGLQMLDRPTVVTPTHGSRR